MLGSQLQNISNVLKECPNARVIFASATVRHTEQHYSPLHITTDYTQQVSEDVSRLLYELYMEDASGNTDPTRNMHNVQTDLKSRPTFQANFNLLPNESKDETLRCVGDEVNTSLLHFFVKYTLNVLK